MLAILILGIVLFSHGETTVGGIVMFIGFAGMLIQRLEQAARFFNRILMDAPLVQEFFEVLDTAPGPDDRKRAVTLKKVRGLTQFEHVTSYDGKMPAVVDLTFAADPGQLVALVGATGAGKSTAMALLYRVNDPQSGTISIDGRDIRDVKLASLRRNIGGDLPRAAAVQPFGRGNLRVGNPDATEADIRAAIERAQTADFIERARALSGGERQRLSIARAT
jgi:ATP-binding cassette, subfamily B, beta-glucan exporter